MAQIKLEILRKPQITAQLASKPITNRRIPYHFLSVSTSCMLGSQAFRNNVFMGMLLICNLPTWYILGFQHAA